MVVKRTLKVFLGILILIIGIAGLVLPIIPGLLLIAVSLVVLGVIEKKDIANWVARVKRRFNKK